MSCLFWYIKEKKAHLFSYIYLSCGKPKETVDFLEKLTIKLCTESFMRKLSLHLTNITYPQHQQPRFNCRNTV